MKTVVLLHGWGTNAAVFDAISTRLADHYSVHAPGLPGYDGQPACEPYALERLAETIAAAAPAQCYVAGWSLGAQVALAWAHARPAQVERLALIGATPCFAGREDWLHAVAPAVFQAFADSLALDREATLTRFISLQARGDVAAKHVRASLHAALAARPMPGAATLEQGLAILAATDLRSVLCAIAQPTLVVHGARDALVPLAAAEYLARELANAKLEVLRGAAHAPFLSAPDIVCARIAEHFS